MWRIDVSEAAEDHPDLAGTIQDVQNKLANPNFVKSVCIHESAHATYWNALERATTPDYTVRIRDYGVEYAATLLVNPTEPKEWTALGLAKAHAAGGVASELLAPGYESGDSIDFENFRKDILAVTPANLDDIKAVWQTAREEIKIEIQIPDSPIRADIERRAIGFERNFRLISEIGQSKRNSASS